MAFALLNLYHDKIHTDDLPFKRYSNYFQITQSALQVVSLLKHAWSQCRRSASITDVETDAQEILLRVENI